jgi:hypothetical protein
VKCLTSNLSSHVGDEPETLLITSSSRQNLVLRSSFQDDVFISLKTKFRASVITIPIQVMVLRPHGAGVCVLHLEEICETGKADWAAALKNLSTILQSLQLSNMSKNSCSRWTVLCIKFLFAGAQQVQSSPDIVVSAFCSFIGDEHALYHWTVAEYTHCELAFYYSFSEIAEGAIW